LNELARSVGCRSLLPAHPTALVALLQARGVQLHLRRAALSLHTAQQLLLEGLSASLMPEPQAAEPDSGPSRSSPAVRRPQQGDPFLVLQQLALEHRHDGSSTFQQLLLGAPAAAGADAKPALQSVSVQLGATSLTVSAQLVRWAHRQRSPSRQAAGRKVRGGQPALAAELRLERLLSLLPKEVEVAAESCTVTTAGTDAHAASGLPLQAVFGLRGVSCRLAKAVAAPPCAGEPSPGSSGATPALACVAAGWQELSLSLGAASCRLPAAVQLSSGGAEWSVELSAARPGASQLAAVGRVGIGALTTRVCHPAVQPLVQRLRSSVAALQAAAKPGAGHASSGDPAAPASQQPNGKPRSPPLLAEWQGSVTLGDGSRLLFTDAEARCCWSCGLESCRLAVQASGGRIRSSEESEAGEPGGVSLVASFEAAGIEMHALASAASGLGGADPSGAPPQMLAAKLLRVHVEHAQQPSLDHLAPQQQLQQGQGQPASKEGPAVDATTAGVHVLLQQQQLSQVASVIVSLLPAPAVAAEAGGAADADPLTQVAAAAAAAGSKRRVSGLFRPRLSFSCSDTLLLLPVTVALPADQTPSGQLQLLPAAPALLLSSVGGRLAGGGASASAEGCTLLYCEGPLSQRFPSSTDALKGGRGGALLLVAVACTVFRLMEPRVLRVLPQPTPLSQPRRASQGSGRQPGQRHVPASRRCRGGRRRQGRCAEGRLPGSVLRRRRAAVPGSHRRPRGAAAGRGAGCRACGRPPRQAALPPGACQGAAAAGPAGFGGAAAGGAAAVRARSVPGHGPGGCGRGGRAGCRGGLPARRQHCHSGAQHGGHAGAALARAGGIPAPAAGGRRRWRPPDRSAAGAARAAGCGDPPWWRRGWRRARGAAGAWQRWRQRRRWRRQLRSLPPRPAGGMAGRGRRHGALSGPWRRRRCGCPGRRPRQRDGCARQVGGCRAACLPS
jgi:hypothetical protein